MTENEIGSRILDAAIEVHRELGPGLFEVVYEKALYHELAQAELAVNKQVPVEVFYKDITLDNGFRVDLLVEDQVLLELKSVEAVRPVHKKQLQTYLRLTDCRLGYLLNFNVPVLKDGITRCVHNLPE